jgi:hypothetical protein
MAARPALHTAGSGDGVPGPVGAAYARLSQAAGWAASGITPQTGVVYAGNQALLTATGSTAPMQVKVSPLHFVESKADAQGVYQGANDGDYLCTIAAAPGSGSRTDVVYIMQQDSSPGTTSPDATTQAVIAATSGALPAGAVRIGSVVVPAGVTKLTDAGVVVATDCDWAAAVGAPRPVSNQAKRDALTKFVGLQVKRLDAGGRIETWDGTAWDFVDWINLPIGPSNWDAPTGTRWQASRRGNVVYFRGTLRNAAFVGFATICTLPAGIPAPPVTTPLPTSSNTNGTRYITVEPDGSVELQSEAASGAYYHIGGSYRID